MRKALHLRQLAALSLLAAVPFCGGAVDRLDNLEARLLAAHNRERSDRGVPALVWNAALAADARDWADRLAATRSFDHAPVDSADPDPQGENLWLGTSGHYTPEAMVTLWVAGKNRYRPGLFPHVSETGRLEDVGHYTQVMWRATHDVGCAISDNGTDEYVVCRYATAGNVEGERPF